ncbi:MAG: HAD hydrolase family protein, partial [candidate division NC10 bacterium]
ANKSECLLQMMARLGIKPGDVAVMGDDLPDLPVMKSVGLALAPANAVPELRRAAHWVSRRRGGEGAVREAIEMILEVRKAWPPPALDGR